MVDEIDGRDGDIVTKLGYAAYDKEFSIGLHGDFDINDVIAFFATEGTCIFSTEPDKKYEFQVLEQIDFERLIRFRTATVKMHVQPFKHSAVEKPLTFNTTNADSVTVTNVGNTTSKPTITITGGGTISLSLNNYQVFTISLGTEGYITIDAEAMNAYKDDVLKNRLVAGDYDHFVFNVGDNVITWTGNVTEITVERYSRWI